MSTLADLHRAVETTLASKRLGQPVFVRYLWHSLDKPEAVLPRLAHVTATIRGWLGQTLERVYGLGELAAGQVTLTLEFREGGSALVSWARSQAAGSGVDLLVLGNRGALYHDAGSAELGGEPLEPSPAAPDASLQAVIAQALRSGKPAAAGAEGKP